MAGVEPLNLNGLAPLAGRWRVEAEHSVYLGPDEGAQAPHGLAVARLRVRSGELRTTVYFDDVVSVGRLVLGYNAATGAYYSAGIGGYGFAYVIDEFAPGRGWRGVRVAGDQHNLGTRTPYAIEVRLRGQSVRLTVNGVRVLEGTLPHPLSDEQVGVFAWGSAPVRFEGTSALTGPSRAFVVMQFGDRFDSVYRDVISRVADEAGYKAHRADEVYGPGLILGDIIRDLIESDVIIADITPQNANVFYELGYAHALGKSTILLAERGRQLPFDVSGYRVVFYDNTIKGKGELEVALRRHLQAIREGEE